MREDGYTHVAVAGARSFAAPGIPVPDCPVFYLGPPEQGNYFGPDLAFIRLPEDYATGIGESGKRFYDLASYRKPAETLPPTSVGEPRLVFAVPGESTSKYLNEEGTGPEDR